MKRIVFAVLHARGSYMLSRNFRLQRVGDLKWLLRNYRLAEVSAGIDELMVLNVDPTASVDATFVEHVGRIARECFIPVAAGGGVRSIRDAERLLEVGVDKVVVNELVHTDPDACAGIAARFGSQFLIHGVDVLRDRATDGVAVRTRSGPARPSLDWIVARGGEVGAGELLLQSVDRDGTGNGLDLGLLGSFAPPATPLILMGGVGRAEHLLEGLLRDEVDAVATAHLLNFVGDALVRARAEISRHGVPLAEHPVDGVESLRGQILGR